MSLGVILEQRPSAGILASFGGFGASVLAWLEQASVVVGFIGAVFGLAAGFYTWKIQRAKSRRVSASEEQICDDCRRGQPPEFCPFPLRERPHGCPHRDTIPFR